MWLLPPKELSILHIHIVSIVFCGCHLYIIVNVVIGKEEFFCYRVHNNLIGNPLNVDFNDKMPTRSRINNLEAT